MIRLPRCALRPFADRADHKLMPDLPKAPRRPITDSPWFWLYLFCTAGLVALVLAGRKFPARQAELERQYQGRQRAAQRALGQEPSTPISTPGQTIITLRPLYLVLGGALIAAWSILWWTHLRQRPPGGRRADRGTRR